MSHDKKKMPVFATGTVHWNEHSLIWTYDEPERSTLLIDVPSDDILPVPGQFFMLRSRNSKQLLGRPISFHDFWKTEHRIYKDGDVLDGDFAYDEQPHTMLEFIVLGRGAGTKELIELRDGDKVEILGPLGNGFPPPSPSGLVCLVSGGVGVAPISSFAATLPEGSYDFYASFKSDSYGLEKVNARAVTIATEDGSDGVQGKLPVILNAEILEQEFYDAVYACGPTPMLKYVKEICEKTETPLYVSMENRMACGVGVCLGCTIKTTEGNKRCCKDGPVFPGEILTFEDTLPKVSEWHDDICDDDSDIPDMSVEIAGVKLKNPVIAASGTFGYGIEYQDLIDISKLGAVCSKGLTLEPRAGNSGVRIHELTNVGMMNSIGLENPGIEHFIHKELVPMLHMGTGIIVNLSGSSIESYVEGAKLLNQAPIDMVELNISCPNVKAGGMAFGMNPQAAAEVTSIVKGVLNKPLIVKLTPNAPNLVEVALAVRAAGADAISLVNTFQALAIDIETGKPVFDNICAGYSGPGIKPIALRMVYDVAKAIRRIDPDYPIIGLGGITNWKDAVEFIMAGATAIQIGTATFSNPNAMIDTINGIRDYMLWNGFETLDEFRGTILE